MRMSKAAQYHLATAMVFHGQYRILVDGGEIERANMYAEWRDEHLSKAGLPLYGDMVQVRSPDAGKSRVARRAAPRASLALMIPAVRAYARLHYGKDGWDYVVEAWSDADIEKAIGKARTINGAIRAVANAIAPLAEQRAEAVAAGEW